MFDVVLVEGREALAANAGLVAVPSADGTTIEHGGVARLHDGRAGWPAAGPGRPRHPDRGRPDARRADLPGRGRAGAALPGHDRVERPDRQRPAADGRAGSRCTRVPLRARAPVHRGGACLRDDARRPLRARARACAPVRRRAPLAGGAGRARLDRRAPRALARPGQRRFARWPSSRSRRSPTSASSISCTARGSSVARSSTPIPRCRTPRARSSASHPRSAATRRWRSRSARAGRSSCR